MGFAMTPLLWAAEKNHESLVNFMTAKERADVSLTYLIRNSQILGQEKALNLVKKMISSGDGFLSERHDLDGKTPMHLACLAGDETPHGVKHPRTITSTKL